MLYGLINGSLPMKPHTMHIDESLVWSSNICLRLLKRQAKLFGMAFTLMVIRLITSDYQLPQFTRDENPIAAHPDLLTRVC